MRKLKAASLLLAVAAVGCSEGHADALSRLCDEKLEMSAAVCQCVTDRAEAELTRQGRDLLVAMLEEDEERAARLRDDLDLTDATRVASFVTTAPAACAAEISGAER